MEISGQYTVAKGPNDSELDDLKEAAATGKRPRAKFSFRGLGGVVIRLDVLVERINGGWFLQGRTPSRRLLIEIENYNGQPRTSQASIKSLPRIQRHDCAH